MSLLQTTAAPGPVPSPRDGGLTGALGEVLAGVGVPAAQQVAAGVVFLAALVAVWLAGRLVLLPLFSRVLDRRGLDAHARRPLEKVAFVVLIFVGVSLAFGVAGYGDFLQSLATVAAAATLAIGFAMQDVIANFVAGVFIFTDKPFRIGDWIEWDGNAGIVEDISFRVTRVRTFDNELLTVPNSNLTDGVVKNPVAKEQLRLQVPFGIGYDDDIDAATDIVLEEAEAHPDILDDPAPSVRLSELGDSSVVLNSRVWIADPSRSDFVKTRGEYTRAVKERFDGEDIDIPYPNRTIGGGLQMEGFEELVAARRGD
jgi:small-conductance mechanosensitive channel